MTGSNLKRAIHSALLASAAVVVTTPALAAEEKMLSEVIVTGSRIANRDAAADTPILTITQETMTNTGYVAVEQFLNTLPQIIPGISSQSNNPSSNGRAFIDLRGLGQNRNLVLIDGRRGMGSTSGGVVDVNTIPPSLIDRVEVITGGAAASYGADAISGVVNFIMKKDFEGLAVNAVYRLTELKDGREMSTDATYGGKFMDGRGHATFGASYYKREALYKNARPFAAQAAATTAAFPGGSYTTGTNTPTQGAVDAIFGPNLCNTNGGGGFGFNPDGSLFCTGVQDDPTRQAVGYRGPQSAIATAFYPDIFTYNFEPDNILVLPLTRFSTFSNFSLDVNQYFQPYVSMMFTNYNATQQLAPTPASGTTGFTVPVTNPFIGTQLRSLLVTRGTPGAAFTFAKRFNDLGGRIGYNQHDVFQVTAGAKGDITDNWHYDAYMSYGRSAQDEVQGGNIRLDRTQALLNAADGGASLCTGGLNLFGAAPISKSCRDYISLEAKNLTIVEQNVIEAVVNGELFHLPAGKVLSAFGVAYRDLLFDFKPDAGLQPGAVAGFNQQLPVWGKLRFQDYFGEIDIPILSGLSFAKRWGVTLGARNTDSDVTGNDVSWKITTDWSLNDWARFRAGYQHAVRSPTVAELYSPQVNNFPTFTASDPCNTTGTIAATYRNGPNGAQVRALCTAQSVVAGGATYVQPAGQATGITGGNPALHPEEADSLTIGFVMESPWEGDYLKRASLSVDFWSIKLSEVIDSVAATTIVQRCYNRDGANPTFSTTNSWCTLFTRDAANGGVINLMQLQNNQAFKNTSGVDLSLNDAFPVGPGDLALQTILTYVNKFEEQTTTIDPVYDFAGAISQVTATAAPDWRATLVSTYTIAGWSGQLTSRYINGMIHRNVVTGSSPVTNTGPHATWYFDLTGRYVLNEKLSFRAGVNNLGDKEPQLFTPAVQANTDPSLYDVLGRRYFVGVDMKL